MTVVAGASFRSTTTLSNSRRDSSLRTIAAQNAIHKRTPVYLTEASAAAK